MLYTERVKILINYHTLNPNDSFKLNGVIISSDYIWHGHVEDLAVVAGKKFELLFRTRNYFSARNFFNNFFFNKLNAGLEYCGNTTCDRSYPFL